MKPNILEASALTKRFGGDRQMFARTPTVHAVNDVSFAVQTGETFAIVGESGCGKSTLGRLLLRLIDATRGRVIYQGEDITHWQGAQLRRLRREMQIIFQDPFASLNPGMTIGQIIGEPVAFHGLARNASERRERVARLLTKVGLQPAYAERYPHEFSGGQRQRIGIARALAGEPKLIVGDEPVSALDVSVQAQVINLLESLKAELGLTLVMVAHDLAVIRHMSDRVAVMYLGEIVELAPVDALFDTPLHPYTQALLRAIPASSPHQRRTKPALQGDLPSPTAPPPGCRFHTRCPHAKPRCSQERPLAEALPGGRQVACHFWRDVQNAGSSAPLVASVSAKLNERLALYRDRQAQR
ncbi:oligopeptide/dipeptide ABC transporter ATP-binding protein [Paraburkholderia phymatum]|uniref:Oligopeptide/dipeptide ABC transporter, ATPase subunit n=1 Tax=Paraburkholderia phymatum (strain DSM 17167 / CIP 108236 / LMG 21445 / STM815) TaxID=391038 RepID=B2JSX7_PARP8|nr:oligopeptide/dipeptide ABC transporter ATP-binding protein [Paraburkholderia phymatum]ACC75680.1 oligopeptide/dipeptide ABC transporter, ATPase subunit [Paraburkholderia phymatum STM815]